jgi:methionyl-tRNA formyltransferase
MEKLRIVFMGTPEFAVGILDTIIKNNYNVVASLQLPTNQQDADKKNTQQLRIRFVQ